MDVSSTAIVFASANVSLTVTLFFGAILVGLIVCLALEEKLHAKKSIIAGVFAAICLFFGSAFGILPFEEIVIGSHPVVESEELDLTYQERDEDLQHLHLDAIHEASDDLADQPPAVDPAVENPAPVAGDGDSADAGHHQEQLHVGGHRLSMPVYIPGIDWGVIAIILGSSLFVDVTSRSGLFTWIAIKVTKASGGDPVKLLAFYGIMTVVFSAVLNNVTAMIIVGSLTAVSLAKLHRQEKLLGFLLIEGLLTNIGGLLTLISSVPNIIVGTAADIDFLTFLVKSAPFVVVATAVTIWMGCRIFEIRRLQTKEERDEAKELVSSFDENDGIESRGFFWFGAAMLMLFIITIATTSVLPYISDLQMGYVALAFAGIMLLRFKGEVDKFYRELDWDLLGFFMALFIVINVMEHAQVLDLIGAGLAQIIDLGRFTGSGLILLSSAVFSSVTDNIPLAAMLSKILVAMGTPADSPLWWAVIFGANLGGNITPIGSASTLVAVTIIHKNNLPLSFAGFVKLALPFAVVQIVLATIYVLVFLT